MGVDYILDYYVVIMGIIQHKSTSLAIPLNILSSKITIPHYYIHIV